MMGWRGKLACLVPNQAWRKIIDLSSRSIPRPDSTIEDLRATVRAQFASLVPTDQRSRFMDDGIVYVIPSNSRDLLRVLKSAGAAIHPVDRSAMSGNSIRGWTCASVRMVGNRRDLAESIGIKVFEVPDALDVSMPNALDFSAPVDLVYTWVDGADHEWREQFNLTARRLGAEQLPTALDEARYMSNDELKYSLRSVEAFLPWVNHIYVVTAGQTPDWLDLSHPKISIVSHEAIFKQVLDLPTFNSHAIESQIHRITGLSEHFLYVNDDVLFGRSVGPGVFFTGSGLARFNLSEKQFETDYVNGLPVNIAAKNNASVMKERFCLNTTFKFKHVAHAQRRSVLMQIERENPALVEATAGARFRSSTDLSIPSSLAHYYGLALGKAVPGNASYKYVDLGASNAQLALAKVFWSRRPQMICINQVSSNLSDVAEQQKVLSHFLEHVFPWPSSMELADTRLGTQ